MFGKKLDWTAVRNAVAFWIFGLCNNFGYVVMLSAAVDIMAIQKGDDTTQQIHNCEEHITGRHCTPVSTGTVLLADCLPSLVATFAFPFFMHRCPFIFRHIIVCLCQAVSYLIVAFSANVPMSLVGVCFASLGSGIGEVSCLALTSHYPTLAIAAWSSGTGAAGLFGSFVYAFLTDRSMGNLRPKIALLIMLCVPLIYFFSYFFILVVPKEMYRPAWSPLTWIVPEEEVSKEKSDEKNVNDSSTEINGVGEVIVTQKKLTFMQRLRCIMPILHLMIPLSIVYFAEYLINQGVNPMVIFNCKEGFNLTLSAQYRWYLVLYQFGVFLSRSSVKLFALPTWMLYLLPVLQSANFFFFFFEAIYWFVPNIGIIFAVIVFEGLVGGGSYVNTFNKIYEQVPADVREFSMAAAAIGNAIGINLAGFLAIPLHNYICGRELPTVR